VGYRLIGLVTWQFGMWIRFLSNAVRLKMKGSMPGNVGKMDK
jgi:hypothetical protein